MAMKKKSYVCIDWFSKHSLSTYYVSSTILGTEETSVKKKNKKKQAKIWELTL